MLRKTACFWLLLLVIAAALNACRTSREERAARSVTDFFKAIEDDDFEAAKELATDDTRKILVPVAKEAKDFRKDVKPAKVEVTILDKQVADKEAFVTVNVKIGPGIKKERVKLVLVEDKWLVAMLQPQIRLVRYVVFYDQYGLIVLPKIRISRPVIVVKADKDKDHPGRGHAYGKRKHKHKDHDND